MFKTKGGGGVKGFLNNVQKNCGSGGGWLPLSSSQTWSPELGDIHEGVCSRLNAQDPFPDIVNILVN